MKKVITHWPDMLRVAGSLVTNQVRAYDPLRMFGREGHRPRSADVGRAGRASSSGRRGHDYVGAAIEDLAAMSLAWVAVLS